MTTQKASEGLTLGNQGASERNASDGTRSGNTHDEVNVGDAHTGLISNVTPLGVFVVFGRHSGLCYSSDIPAAINRDDLFKGRAVRVRVRKIRPDGKISVVLLNLLPAGPTDSHHGEAPRSLSNGAVVADNLNYSQDIHAVVSKGVDEINAIGQQYGNNTAPTRTGFVAEADHPATFNIDATFQGSEVRAERLGSHARNSPDVAVREGNGSVAKEVSSKIYKTSEATAKAQRGYGNQDRLSPQDQVADIKEFSSKRAATERAKQGPNRQRVATEYDEVAQKATDHLEHGKVKSTPRTRAKSKEIAEKARTGTVTGKDIVGEVGKRMQQGATQGGKMGGATGAGMSAVTGTYQAVKDVRSGRKTAGEATLDVVIEVVKGGTDGAVKGMASGAATAGARVLAERTASESVKRVLGGSGPAAAAITAVEIAKHAIDFARGVKTAEQFGQASKASAKSGAASFVGAEIGFAIGGPVGAAIGGIAGPMLADKAEEVGLGVRLDRLFSANTATGHHGATVFHLEQLRSLLTALQRSSAVVFLDRIIVTGTGHQVAAEIVMAHQGKIYAVDFKAWKGTLSFPEIMETRTVPTKFWEWGSTKDVEVGTGRYDTKRVNQLKVDQYEIAHTKGHENPLRSLARFASHMKDRLIAKDSRWKRVRIETLAVFPDDSVQFSGDMVSDSRFLMFRDFLKLLAEDDGTNTPKWMLDGLSMTPTWDVLQDPNGNIYQGLIQTPHFTMRMHDGVVDIPFDAVLKIEVAHGGLLSRSDHVTVILHDRNKLEGTVEKQEVVLLRKRHSNTFMMRDLSLVCPAYSLLSG